MRIGSVFSGIGGLDLGLQRAGHSHAFFCESEPWRREVLRTRFPGVPVFDDVRTLGKPAGGTSSDETGAPTDDGGREAGSGVSSGSMGMDGLRVGQEHRAEPDAPPEGGQSQDETIDLLCGGFPCQDLSIAGRRAGLAGDKSGLFFEFARVAGTLRPRYVLLENVPGIFSSNGGRDFGTVLETLAHLGYGVAWRVLDSRFFGVPQRRRRVFILGTLSDGDSRAAAERAGQILAVGQRCGRHPTKGKKKRPYDPSPSLSGLGSGGADDNDAQARRLVARPILSRKGSGYRNNPDTIDNLVEGHVGIRRLTPLECERLQGLPDEWTQLGKTSDAKRYAALGDAVTCHVAKWLGERLDSAEKGDIFV